MLCLIYVRSSGIIQRIYDVAFAGSSSAQTKYLAQTNNPELDQLVSIAFAAIDTFFILVFHTSVRIPMCVCNTICHVLCLGSATTGIRESFAFPNTSPKANATCAV